MGVSSGPKIVRSGLTFAIDSGASIRGFSRNGTAGLNNTSNSIKDLISKLEMDLSTTSYLEGVDLYTLYGITYPEGNYTPASRDGITSGFNNISSGLLYDASRSLNYYVHDGTSWVSDSYFNGLRQGGHCYDLYSGHVDESNKFLADYDVIKTNYPNSTHILIGSHACQNFDVTGIRETFVDLGAPKDVLTWANGTWREFVLVGRPGLGAGNAFGWVYQNESAEVAHLNSAIPYENPLGNTSFDGTDDYIDIGSDIMISPNNKGWTAEYVFNTDSASTLQHFNSAEADDFNANWLALLSSKMAVWNVNPGYWRYGSTQFQSNTWYHIAFVQDPGGTNMRFYVNGVAEGGDHVGNSWTASYSSLKTRYIGRYEYNGGYGRYFNGEIPVVKFYKDALSSEEIKQNYNSYKKRFNI
jgi:hypothetical protein